MNLRSWRKVLLQWIGECQFIEHNYISLEQSDIDSFFAIFVQMIQETKTEKGEKALQVQPKKYRTLLQEFLMENYPEFTVHLEDLGRDLLPSEYVYVYTLLLHYSCVKQPSVFFHSICKKMPEPTQTCIASFLGETVDKELTIQYLRESIDKVPAVNRREVSVPGSPCHPSSIPIPDLGGEDGHDASSLPQPSSSTPKLQNHRERLRHQMSASKMPPPATPKTELLEQRTKELRDIRAQLEVVRYEKTVLEEQQLEKDDLIKVLKREKMIAKVEMEKLKNSKLAEEQHDDENSVMPHECERMKTTHLKEIGQKEAAIAEITDKLHDLCAEKSELSERLSLTGERLLEYTDRVQVLENRVEDLMRIVSSREDRITSLEREKQELDQCLQVAREELHGRREVLNASSDLLNCSLSPNTTPENLASSVIDKQLREKEHENAELKEELQNRNNCQLKICRALSSFLQKHKIDHDYPVEWTSLSLLSSISAIESNFVDLVSQNTRMKKECDDQSEYVKRLLVKSKCLRNSLEGRQRELDKAKVTITALECGSNQNGHMKEADIRSENNKRQLDMKRLNEKCDELKSIIAIRDQHLANINLQLAEKEQKMKDVGAEMLELRKRNSEMISQIADQGIDAKNLQQRNEFIRFKYTVCRKALNIKNATLDDLTSMLKVQDIETMVARISHLINVQAQFDNLGKKYNKLKAQRDKQINTSNKLDKEIEMEKQSAQLLEFDEHNQNVDRFLTRILTLLGASELQISSPISSATSVGSVQIERRFEEIEKLIESALLSSDALKREMNELQAKNEELVLKSTHGEKNSEKLKELIKVLEQEIGSKNQRIVHLENAICEQHRNAEQMTQRLNVAHQELQHYYVEAIRFIGSIRNRLHKDFYGINTPQQLGNCMIQFLNMYDQMEVRYQWSSSLVSQLTQSKAQIEQQVAELQKEVASQHTVHSELSESLLRAQNELESRLNRVVELETSERRSSMDLDDCKKMLDGLKIEIANMNAAKAECDKEAKRKEEKISEMKDVYEKQMATFKAECDKEAGKKEEKITEMKDMYEKQMAALKAECGKQAEEKEEKISELKDMYEKQLTALEAECGREAEENEGLQINLKETNDKLLSLEEVCKKLTMTARDNQENRCKEYDKRCGDLRNLCKELEEQLGKNERPLISESSSLSTDYSTDDMSTLGSEEEQCMRNQELVKDKFENCFLSATSLEKIGVKGREELLCLLAKLEEEQKLVNTLKVELDKKREELDQVKTALEAQQKHSDDLQGQNKSAQQDLRMVKERLVKSVREFQVNLVTLENQLKTLHERHTTAEADRATAYERINKLETRNQEKDDTISKLKGQISNVETLQHQLQSEMGSHNLLVEQLNRELAEKASELLDVQNRLRTAIAECNQAKDQLAHISDRPEVVELQHRLEKEAAERKQAQKKLDEVTDRLDAVVLELDDARLEHGAQKLQMEEEAREAEKRIELYKQRLDSLERLLAACNEELAHLNSVQTNQTEGSRDLGATYSTADGRQTESDKETARSNKLALDCQILQAKYSDAKDEIQRCEQKIKDQRLEMEGKLEKMKNKMRSLYTAEMTRMKEKQERDASKSATEVESLTAQTAKYEEHTRKLSNQIVRLNEKILEQQKQHAITSTKLRHLQMQPISETKPSTTPLTVSSSSSVANDDWQPFKQPNVPSSNLAMEDEEGEVFNNTYLTDLKLGRVPADMTAEELIYRNSLQPPHLKSTYAAQYDLGSQDEDLKDGPHSLDDSMSALLSSSSTGTRKKSMGTHYKRPGPPTPSKNGGRLSFGSSEPPREILREFGDHNNTFKTPARFKFLTQRFSVGSSGLPRDENSPPKRRLSNMFKRK